MKYKLVKRDVDNGCDGCCFNIKGKRCQLPAGAKAECEGGGIYIEVDDDGRDQD